MRPIRFVLGKSKRLRKVLVKGGYMEHLCIRDLPVEERPREKFVKYGAARLSNAELIAILLRTGRKGQSVIDLSKEVLRSINGGASGLNLITISQLQEIKGIGEDKAVTVCAAIELGRRLSQLKVKALYEDFSNPKAVAEYMMEKLRHERQEHFCAALLTSKNKLIQVATISIGGLTASMAEPRAVFKKAVDENAAAIILVHNHPSGDPTPSADDIKVTRTFVAAGSVMGIPVLDHIVIGDGKFISLAEHGHV